MRVFESPQGSDDWKAARLGHFTASKASELLMTPGNVGYKNLINQIVYERLTGEPVESYKNEWMEYGNETEDEAAEAYEFLTFRKVHKIGFIELNEWVGASLDRTVGKDGGVEIKCRKWNVQLESLEAKKVPTAALKQIQFQIYVSGKKWIEYFSYHPKLPPLLIRVFRDQETIQKIEDTLTVAIFNVNERLKELK